MKKKVNHKILVVEETQLMSDVSLLEKVEVSQVSFNPKPLDIENFCQDLIAEIQRSTNTQHKIIFTMQVSCRKREDANVLQNEQLLTMKTQLPSLDEKLLRHILTNLLCNAIKYSPQGGIVRFDLFNLQEEAIFRIQDESIGIPEFDQENLFNFFCRGSNVGKILGDNLGLALVKQYVELHGGQITFASKVGVGTTFIVSLPFNQ